MFYSKSTGGFYTTDIHGNNIPVDAVEITSEQYSALLQAQSNGASIQADADGYPVAALSVETIDNSANEARQALEESNTTILRCVENGITVPVSWRDYRKALREIITDGTGTLPIRPEYPIGIQDN